MRALVEHDRAEQNVSFVGILWDKREQRPELHLQIHVS
jgi:hypothetical protein